MHPATALERPRTATPRRALITPAQVCYGNGTGGLTQTWALLQAGLQPGERIAIAQSLKRRYNLFAAYNASLCVLLNAHGKSRSYSRPYDGNVRSFRSNHQNQLPLRSGSLTGRSSH